MKNIRKAFLAFLPLLLCACGDDPRPNIIFIMADDHANRAISAYDASLVATPNIDQLAHQGLRFDRAFVTNSLCAPSRATALTGQMGHINGVMTQHQKFEPDIFYPQILRAHGYQTALVGKWHLNSPYYREYIRHWHHCRNAKKLEGADAVCPRLSSPGNLFQRGFDYWKILPGQGDYHNPDFFSANGIISERGDATDIITDSALNWLDNIRDKSKPFLLLVHHKAPHREPLTPPLIPSSVAASEPATLFDDYRGRSAAKRAKMRISNHLKIEDDNQAVRAVLELPPPMRVRDARTLTSRKYQSFVHEYAAKVRRLDANIGKLLRALSAHDLTDNTLVIYTSDQGIYLGEHGWFDKRFMYEESFRIPLLMRWPKAIKPARVSQNFVQNIDFAPTILHAAGLAPPPEMQGVSLLPLFDGGDHAWRDVAYYHYFDYSKHSIARHYGVRTERYKLIHFYYPHNKWELFDLARDPHEVNNIYADRNYLEIKTALHRWLEALRAEYQDTELCYGDWCRTLR